MKGLLFLGVVFLAVVIIDSLEERFGPQEEYWEPEPETDLMEEYPFYRSLN